MTISSLKYAEKWRSVSASPARSRSMYARSKECRSTSALLEVNGKTTITSPAFDAYRFVSTPAACRTVMACGVGSRARSKWQPPRAVTTVLDDEPDGLLRDEEFLFGLLIRRSSRRP